MATPRISANDLREVFEEADPEAEIKHWGGESVYAIDGEFDLAKIAERLNEILGDRDEP